METNDKLMTLLRLMDEPEAMTEAQLQELLSDEEVRKAYDVMADCKKVFQDQLFGLKHRRENVKSSFFALHFSLRKIAAVFLGIAILGGLAFAAIRLMATDPALEAATTDTAIETIEVPSEDVKGNVRFDNVRLDSILSTVAAHYGKTVSFFSGEAKAMKFIMTWKPDAPLTDFIDRLNLFDDIRLSLQRDTIFVEITEKKEDKK